MNTPSSHRPGPEAGTMTRELFEALFGGVRDAVLLYTVEDSVCKLKLETLNAAAWRLLACTRAEALARPALVGLGPQFAAELPLIAAELEKEGTARRVTVVRTRQGDEVSVQSLWQAWGPAGSGQAICVLHPAAVLDSLADPVQEIRRALTAEKSTRKQIEQQVRRLATALAHAANAVVITDPYGHIEWVNNAFTTLTGYSAEEVRGQRPSLLKSGVHGEDFYQSMWRSITAGGVWRGETTNRRKDGSHYISEITISPVHADDGEVIGFIGIQQDITERKQLEQRLQLAAQALASIADGVIVTDTEGKILSINQAFTVMTGYKAAELVGHNPRHAEPGGYRPAFYHWVWGSLVGQNHWQGELWDRRKNGEVYPQLATISAVTNAGGETTHYVGVLKDITEQKAAAETIRHLAYHDPLTDLPNRTLFNDRLQEALAAARGNQKMLAVMFFDLDGFKLINDAVGHLRGDEVLKSVAAQLLGCVRPSDTVARWGGDEFTVLLPDINSVETAAAVARRICTGVHRTWQFGGHEFHLGTSVGIAIYPNDGDEEQTLLRHADTARNHAKRLGGDNYQFFEAALNTRMMERITLEADLRRAAERQEFVLSYQPRFELSSGQATGFEALIRWQHPTRGLLLPDQFIPVAEETGIILTIGKWALQTACRQNRSWQAAGLAPVPVAINLSARQFLQPNLVETIEQTLAESGLEPSWLELEITESTAMQEVEKTVTTLRTLRAMGIRIAIDDFGTGYSSLSYLTRLPITTLKIDRSFVQGLSEAGNAAIVGTVVALAAHLDLEVVAEGVETDEQVSFLQEHRCTHVQGYRFSQPLTAAAATAFLRRDNRRPQATG